MQRSENRGRIDATLQPRRNQFRTAASNVARQPKGISARPAIPSRPNHITQKVRIGGRTLYLSVHDDQARAEIFLRVKGDDCTPEAIALYDVIARVMSIALRYGAPSKRSETF